MSGHGNERERGEPHPLLEQRPTGAYYIGDESLLQEVESDRRIVKRRSGDAHIVEFRELHVDAVAEDGWGSTEDEAMRYALGAYLD